MPLITHLWEQRKTDMADPDFRDAAESGHQTVDSDGYPLCDRCAKRAIHWAMPNPDDVVFFCEDHDHVPYE